MKLSVLIPTLGRKQELMDTVRSLLAQTVLPDEILVVDQNQPSFPEVDDLLASIPIVRHIRSEIKGVCFNYNLALRQAKGDVVLFLDDDIIPDPHLIEMHLKNYRDGVVGVAGRVEQPQGDIDPQRIKALGRYYPWSGRILANFNAKKKCDVQIAPGGNMSFFRDTLLKLGGFDLGFDGNGYFFETDGSLRVTRAGHRIVFEPDAYVKHLMAPSGGARMTDKSLHTYYFVKNGIRLCRRHSPWIGQLVFVLRMTGYVVLKAAYNRNWKILTRGLQAVSDGWRQSLQVQGL